MKIKIICFDIDNVICKTIGNEYKKSTPIKKNITKINKIYNSGFYVKLFTARFMGRSKENMKLAKKRGYEMTKKQLKKWDVKYHELIFGKPSFDLFVDDKSLSFKKTWADDILKVLKLNK